LPYNTEWEFAIAGDSTQTRGMAVVGSAKPNHLDLHDILGNANEWSWDNINNFDEVINNHYKGYAHKGFIYLYNEANRFERFYPKFSYSPTFYDYDTGFRLARSVNLEPKMIEVSGGTFTRGEENLQEVTVTDFEIAKYEITVKEWRYYIKSNKLKMPDEPNWGWHDNDPIMTVSWYEAIRYCNWLSTMDNLSPRYLINGEVLPQIDLTQEYVVTQDTLANGYRLPTEAEWEFAARGGNQSQGYEYSGAEYSDYVAWNNQLRVHKVGTKDANELGIHDMSGNVFEWCWDNWAAYTQITEPINPQGPALAPQTGRVLRGGSWYNDAEYLLVSKRAYSAPLSRYTNFGFRIARDK